MRRAAKRDAIEHDIVLALRAMGVTCYFINGTGLPDLICHHAARNRWQPIEVKSGRKGRITEAQQRQFDKGAQWPVIRSVEAAVALFVA